MKAWSLALAACFLAACTSAPTPADFRQKADDAARQLIAALGPQQTFARLGWQQNADYQPAEACFDNWHGRGETALDDSQIADCEAHVDDLVRLFASYGTQVDPIVFKSDWFWAESSAYATSVFPRLVKEWERAGGSEDDASFLKHPNCAEPLQQGWTGSDYFHDGSEHGLCRLYKLEALEQAG